MKKIILAIVAAGLIAAGLTACDNDARVVSQNISTDADNFKIPRRVVFYNGISGEYILEVRGLCSMSNAQTGRNSIAVTCKKENGYVKHFLGVSDNVTWFAEQLDPAMVSASHYKVIFKPSVIIPAVELR